MEQFERIRRDRRDEGLSVRALADRHRVHRRAVRQALIDAVPPPRKTPTRAAPVLGRYVATVRGWLIADLAAPRKQRQTARRIWQRLVEEEGARVGESSVRNLVARLKVEIGADRRQVMVPQTHPPAAEAEVDFGEFTASIAGQVTKLYMFCMRLSHSGKAFHFAYANQTQESFLDGHVRAFAAFGGVPIERCDGPLVEALLDADLTVFVVTPRQVKGLRSRYSGSGAKSDAGDAYLLADVLRTDRHRLTPLTQDSAATQVLRALSRTRKQLVESRVGLVNQLAAELQRCFPGAIGLFSRLDSDVAIAFLRRYPTQHAASKLTQARFAAFLRRIAYCGRKPVELLFARVHEAPLAGLSAAEAEGHAVCVLALLRAIETSRREERELEAEIIERLDAHADAHIFTSLPKAGHGVRAALLLAEIGDVRSRFPDEESLAALAGVAPVTRASGKAHSVGFRWAADKKLRNAIIDFADDSRCPASRKWQDFG